jgi:hypothetical protein
MAYFIYNEIAYNYGAQDIYISNDQTKIGLQYEVLGNPPSFIQFQYEVEETAFVDNFLEIQADVATSGENPLKVAYTVLEGGEDSIELRFDLKVTQDSLKVQYGVGAEEETVLRVGYGVTPEGDSAEVGLGLQFGIQWGLYLVVKELFGDSALKDVKLRLYKKSKRSVLPDSTHTLLVDISNLENPSVLPVIPGPGSYLLRVFHPQFNHKDLYFDIQVREDLTGGLLVELERKDAYKFALI